MGNGYCLFTFNVHAVFPMSEGNANSLPAATLARFKAFTCLERDLQSFARKFIVKLLKCAFVANHIAYASARYQFAQIMDNCVALL